MCPVKRYTGVSNVPISIYSSPLVMVEGYVQGPPIALSLSLSVPQLLTHCKVSTMYTYELPNSKMKPKWSNKCEIDFIFQIDIHILGNMHWNREWISVSKTKGINIAESRVLCIYILALYKGTWFDCYIEIKALSTCNLIPLVRLTKNLRGNSYEYSCIISQTND